MQIAFSMTYVTTSYFLSDQPVEIVRFAMVLGVLILVALISSSMGLVIGSIVNPVVRNNKYV